MNVIVKISEKKMSETNVKCFLRCLKSSHPDILLKHSEEMVLGRQLSTLIKDVRCSRSQLKFVADCIQYSVEVTQVGMNPSFYNGQEIGSGKKVTLHHNDTVNFLEKEFEHQEIFSLLDKFVEIIVCRSYFHRLQLRRERVKNRT